MLPNGRRRGMASIDAAAAEDNDHGAGPRVLRQPAAPMSSAPKKAPAPGCEAHDEQYSIWFPRPGDSGHRAAARRRLGARLARALVAGGVKVLEITFAHAGGLTACAPSRSRCQAIVGAGTIRSVADAQASLAAGCRFGVTPGYPPDIGRACRDIGLPRCCPVAGRPARWRPTPTAMTSLKFPGHRGRRHPAARRRCTDPSATWCSAPHRRHHAGDRAAVPGAAQRQGLWRLLADAAGGRGPAGLGRITALVPAASELR